MKVAAAGLNYVGTLTAASVGFHRHDVSGVDVDAAKVDEICARKFRGRRRAGRRCRGFISR